ncbi:MAG: quinol:cytochrome C oxidoreductase, partial [Planctomycetota bacterium]|nr:quinol:cytochrome C oxidoreductase [Planctomycetota bacterium]
MGTEIKRTVSSAQLSLGALRGPVLVGGGVVGLVGLGGALGLSMGQGGDWYQSFSASYLVSFCFYISIALGGLFWVTAMHLTRAGWGICVRRLCEILAMMTLPMLVFFLPILLPVILGSSSAVYSWVNIESITHARDLVEHKAGYLNGGFFTVRAIAYFAVWGLLARFYLKNSVSQDLSKDPKTTLKMQSRSAPGMLLFALTVVFASFDWEKSLDPLWFSTMFPVYFFAGGVLGSLCVLTITSVSLQKSGRLTEDITTEHYHDLGTLTFGFVFFWAYIAFSQYLLIWYANIPEETVWFLYRQQGGWEIAS